MAAKRPDDVPEVGGVSRALSAEGLLGVPRAIAVEVAAAWHSSLLEVWQAQVGRAPGPLHDDLAALDRWFNPSRTGQSLRAAIAKVTPVSIDMDDLPSQQPAGLIWLDAGNGRLLITPEGRVLLEVLARSLKERPPGWVLVEGESLADLMEVLVTWYRGVSRQRLLDVLALLNGDSKQTMGPAVAGLLLVLLVNRNTASERALLKFLDDRQVARALASAIATPAAAYAQAFASDSDAVNAVDPYRGWAYGELARRLGSSFHNTETGIYVSDEDRALRLLADHVASRPRRQQLKVPEALDRALDAYYETRGVLHALGIAFERPSHTRRVISTLKTTAVGDVAGDGDGN